MKVLVTGADGMLGSNVVRKLLKKKLDVTAFLHPSSNSKTLDGLGIRKVFGCLLNTQSLEIAIKDQDYVIHAAALTNVWPNRSKMVRDVNIEGTRNIIDLCIKHDVRRLVYVGSAAAYRNNCKQEYAGKKYGLDYIDSKFEACQLVNEACRRKHLDAITIMPTFMIGPYDSLPSSGKLIMSQAMGKLKFCPTGGKNFVSAEDVATAIANGITLGKSGKTYLAGNKNLSYKSFLGKVSRITGIKPPAFVTPAWLVKSIGAIGTLYGQLTGRSPLLSYTMARISCELEFYENARDAVKELRMPQSSISEAIRKSYYWLHVNGYC